MIRRAFFVVGLFLTAALIQDCSSTAQDVFLERSVKVGENTFRYRVWLPPHYTRLKRLPVILFLHASSERGDDNLSQLTTGLPVLLRDSPWLYNAIVVIPQCRPDQEWYGVMEQQALAALEQSIREFRGDRSRIYLTGMSLGGAGVWYFARHPQEFAALVPVCGEVVRQRDDPFPREPPPDLDAILSSADPYGALAKAIGRTPVWAFHGAHDDVIPVTQSRRMIAALQKAGTRPNYTEYPLGKHDVWDLAYGDRALVLWLFKQKKGP